MQSSKALLLVHKNMAKVKLSHRINIMLSPQLYTLKKETLPVKYLYQARRIAPSLFNGLLENTDGYEYFVYREEESWVFIAYDLEQIHALLLEKGIQIEQVGKIFFAQQIANVLTSPLLLGEKEILLNIDNTVTLVPEQVLQDRQDVLTFNDGFTPKTGVNMQSTQHALLSFKQALSLSVVFLFFALMFFVEGQQASSGVSAIQKKRNILLEQYPSLQSKYARESIAAKYRKINQEERSKRESIKVLSDLIFKGVTLTSLRMHQQKYTVLFSCSDAHIAKRLLLLAQKRHFQKVKMLNATSVQIEGVL